MALPTYLQIVNEVLVRLREPTVQTVNENTLSTLVGKWVNEVKRQVNDAYDWDALNTSVTITTVAGQYEGYTLTGSGLRFRITDVINTSRYYPLQGIAKPDIDRYIYMIANPVSNPPTYYNLGGVDSNGDTQIALWPVPDAAYNIRFGLLIPEEDFSSDSATTKMPKEPIILGAYARSLVERGEDAGLNSSEAQFIYKQSLADHIAIEGARAPETDSWGLV